MNWSLPALAMRRPVTTIMLVVTMVGLGLICYSRLPIEYLDSADPPFLSCWIPYPNALPAQVEEEVAIPAEGEFLTIPRVKEVRSWSDSDGCYVFLRFEWGTDMSVATGELRDRIERLRLLLPDEIEHIFLHHRGESDWPVMVFGMFRGDDQEEMAWLARTQLQPKLARIEGAAEAGFWGGEPACVYIDFEQEALRALNLSLYDVIETLRTSSLNLAVGEIQDEESTYYVRVAGEFSELGELENLTVDPRGIRIKDVAAVSMRVPPEEGSYTMDNRRGVFGWVRKESGANVVATCEAIAQTLDEAMATPAFEGVTLHVFHDQSRMILQTLSGLVKAGKYGGALALTVLFVFLRRIRATLLVALALPVSLVSAFIFMYFADISLNVVTMSSMIVSLGMLIDNSIVVIENIRCHHLDGGDAVSSARDGAAEVGLAITAATLTTIIVFLPVFYMEQGEMSLYMRQFAPPVIVALLTSLAVALSVVPLLASRIYRHPHRERQKAGPRPTALRRFERRLAGFYPWALGLTVRWRIASLTVLATLAGATYLAAFKEVGMRPMPELDMREVQVYVNFDRDYGVEHVEAVLGQITEALNDWRDELGIRTVFASYGRRGAGLDVYLIEEKDLAPGESYPYTTKEVQMILSERFPAHIPGAEVYFGLPSAGAEETQAIQLSLRGDDADTAAELAEQFRDIVVRSLPYVVNCRTDLEDGSEEVRLKVDDSIAADTGVNPAVVAQTVGFALRGAQLAPMKRGGEEIDVWAQFRDADRSTMSDLDNVALATPDSGLVSLDQLTTSRKGRTPKALRREAGKSVTHVTVEVTTKNVAEVKKGIEEMIKAFELPQGYSIGLGDALLGIDESLGNFKSTVILAVVLMYLLMAALFESLLLPLSILTTVPLAFIGVYWSMYLTETPFDNIAMILSVFMCGVIVNNGIVIIDHINQLRRRKGMPRLEAILRGGRDRIRPVMMTAVTTILGCVPLAIGSRNGEDVLYSSGRAMVGGLTMGTILTLFVVPLFYSLVDDVQQWIVSFLGHLASLRGAPADKWGHPFI